MARQSLRHTLVAIAQATGKSVVVGTRGEGKGFFAASGETEVEAGSPEAAARALVGVLKRNLEREVRSSEAAVAAASRSVQALDAIGGSR